jgi:hypothetical protein
MLRTENASLINAINAAPDYPRNYYLSGQDKDTSYSYPDLLAKYFPGDTLDMDEPKQESPYVGGNSGI